MGSLRAVFFDIIALENIPEAKVTFKVTQGHLQCYVRQIIRDFRCAFHSNYYCISCRFQDTEGCWLKTGKSFYPTCFGIVVGMILLEFHERLFCLKTSIPTPSPGVDYDTLSRETIRCSHRTNSSHLISSEWN